MANREAKIKLTFNMVSIPLMGSAVAKASVAPTFESVTMTTAVLIHTYLARTKIKAVNRK